MTMEITLIIPAYNEEKRIKSVIQNYLPLLEKFKSYEFLVVFDGNDKTGEIVQSFANNNNHIKLLEYKTRLGKGGALIEGFKKAKGEIIAFVDADDSVTTTEFLSLINTINKGYDVAIASRRVKGSKILIGQPFLRKLSSLAFNVGVNLLFNLGVKDTQCGAKAFKSKPLKTVLGKLKSKGFEFDAELLWRLKRKGYKIIEVPITWTHEQDGTFNLGFGPQMSLNLFILRMKELI